jgi:hypothetical protein
VHIDPTQDSGRIRVNPEATSTSCVVALPKVVGEAQEREGSGFLSPRSFRSRVANRPNSIRRVLSGCSSKPKVTLREVDNHRCFNDQVL